MTRLHVTRARTRLVAGVLAAGLALAATGCGGGGDKDEGKKGSSSKASASQGGGSDDKTSAAPEPTETLAEVKGEQGIVLAINKVTRDSGGFVTVQGTVTNTGDQMFNANHWVGDEKELGPSGASLAGAALVDVKGKKRYYVLRDTDGLCLCTMKLLSVKPEESRPVFAQFPAPPKDVTQVEFQLPTMPPAKITISG